MKSVDPYHDGLAAQAELRRREEEKILGFNLHEAQEEEKN